MRSRPFVLTSLVSTLVLTLAAPGASAQPQLKTRQQIEAEEKAKAEKQGDKKVEKQEAAAAQPGTTVKAGQCLPEGKPAGYGVNTFEDIMAVASFGLKELETPAPAADSPEAKAEPVEWRAVEKAEPESR